MTSHQQDSVILNSPSTSPTLPPRAAPIGGKTCPTVHLAKPIVPHLPHQPLPPMPAARLSEIQNKKLHPDRQKSEADTEEDHEDSFIPEAAEENILHELLSQVARRQVI